MKFIISRYNNDIDWTRKYTNDVVVYDRSDERLENAIAVPNIGSDIYDKFTFIIDNYDNLPDIAVYTKGNLFQYITPEEFEEKLKTREFQPLLTKNHKTELPIAYYENGIYYEINNRWYLNHHPYSHNIDELMDLLGIRDMTYLPFAPGSNYLLTKENIRQHPKELYIKLRDFLKDDVYPGEAQVMERGLYTLWKL